MLSHRLYYLVKTHKRCFTRQRNSFPRRQRVMWMTWTHRTHSGAGSTWQSVESGTCFRNEADESCHWKTAPNKKGSLLHQCLQLVSLQNQTHEYNEVASLFGKTMDRNRIKRIQRIQNLDLWEFFCRKKAQLKKKRGVPQINEQMLFHGTSSEFVEAICIHNFDWRINGVHGAVFGKGTYFARDAAYSSRFCKDDIKHGNTFQIHGVSLQQRHLFRTYKSMFLARVLIGDYINGDSKYMRPPSKDGSYVNLYDSCVDDTWNPKIFVVFDANQIYPEYLIDFH
ncbi:protein mono-ADP-ribosyltransferase PARP11 isoform X2 [Rattus norvegicus]|uniref:protein mono-ADP-ribosyltransferase PARP11 isoform X2 n=1 Tax=Rattus norvegicus TaxID=10116 RepID=UPI002FD7BAAE